MQQEKATLRFQKDLYHELAGISQKFPVLCTLPGFRPAQHCIQTNIGRPWYNLDVFVIHRCACSGTTIVYGHILLSHSLQYMPNCLEIKDIERFILRFILDRVQNKLWAYDRKLVQDQLVSRTERAQIEILVVVGESHWLFGLFEIQWLFHQAMSYPELELYFLVSIERRLLE